MEKKVALLLLGILSIAIGGFVWHQAKVGGAHVPPAVNSSSQKAGKETPKQQQPDKPVERTDTGSQDSDQGGSLQDSSQDSSSRDSSQDKRKKIERNQTNDQHTGGGHSAT